jgi:hypothetical protein
LVELFLLLLEIPFAITGMVQCCNAIGSDKNNLNGAFACSEVNLHYFLNHIQVVGVIWSFIPGSTMNGKSSNSRRLYRLIST